MSDKSRALAALGFEAGCMLLFAVVLQLPQLKCRQLRCVAGAMTAAVILVVQPFIYGTETQSNGMLLAGFANMSAWCVLHWAFLHPTDEQPSVLEVVLSTYSFALQGVCKVHKRFLQYQDQQKHRDMQSCPSLWQLLQSALVTLCSAFLTYDIGLHMLCSMTGGMCSGVDDAIAPLTVHMSQRSAASVAYLVKCAFAFPAGILLTHHMEVIYCFIRLVVVVGGFKFVALRQLAAELPSRAFNWPVAASSVTELWGYRWHQFLRVHFEGIGYAAVDALMPRGRAPAALRASMRCVAAFTLSGLLHEYLTWAVFGSVTGWYMAFFWINCLAVLLENWTPALIQAVQHSTIPRGKSINNSSTVTAHVSARANGSSSSSSSSSTVAAAKLATSYQAHPLMPTWLRRACTLTFFILLGPMFVEPYRAAGFFSTRAYHPLGKPLAPQLVDHLRHVLGPRLAGMTDMAMWQQ